MNMFHPVEDAMVILTTRGVFIEAPLYSYSDRLYAKAKGGHIRLMAQQLTSVHSIAWRVIEGVVFKEQHDGLHLAAEPEKKTKLKVAK